MLIPEDTELPPDLLKSSENISTSEMEFLTEEQFKQNKAQLSQILKWQEVPTEATYHIMSVE